MSLKKKLIILFIAFTLVPLVLFGAVVLSQARNILQRVRIAQLNNIADLKKDKIETFFDERRGDIRSAQHSFIVRRNLPVLSRHLNGRTDPEYVKNKKELDVQMRVFQQAYGYLDVMLTDVNGRIVYISNAEHAAAHLGRLLPDRKAFEEGRKDIYFTDVLLNKTPGNKFELLGLAPVRGHNGNFIGEVVFEIDMDPIYAFIQNTTGLGDTGEGLIVKKEEHATLFLSPLRNDRNAALKKKVFPEERVASPARNAAQGESGSGAAYDYQGREVLAAWRYIPSLRWGLVAKMDAAEAFAPVRHLATMVTSIGIFMVLGGVLAALAMARAVSRPILSLQRGAEAIATGDLSHRVGTDAHDEVGRLSRAFDAMTDAIDRRVRERTRELEIAVAERKEAEKILKLANAYNRSLLEASLDPLVTIDANGRITDVNLATEKVTGRSREELIGTDFSEYFTEPAMAKVGYQQVFEKGFVMDYALEIRRRDGHITPVLYNAAVYRDKAGNAVGVFAAARDITERKKAEEEIKKLNTELEARVIERTAQLESSNRELESFAYSVSHDLRSPLRSIEGFSLALLEDYADRLDGTGKNYLERVRNATVRMGHLIDDMLKLSRVTRTEMNRERTDLSAIVRSIAGRLRKQHPERPADIVIADGIAAYGDESLLTVALENLISNAWKFSEKAPRTVIVFGTMDKNGVRAFFVKDNGIGFDMQYANKLFNPFQRLHRAEEFPGTGIGLATVKRIINRHGGQVWIEAEEGKGATAYFTL